MNDPVVSARLAERAHLVDMEAYGVVYACRALACAGPHREHVSDSADEGAKDSRRSSTPAPASSATGDDERALTGVAAGPDPRFRVVWRS